MDRALDISPGEERERVARVHRERPVLGPHPIPRACGVVPDLERRDGLAEEQRPRAEIGVALAPEPAELRVFLGRVLGVLHVPEVVLALARVVMDRGQPVFWELERDREEDVQRVEHFGVQRLGQ